MADETVKLERDGAVCRLVLNRPDRLNACTRAMLSELSDALSEIATDDTVRAVVLTGAGRAFCAGQDLMDKGSVEDGRAIRDVLERHYNPIVRQIRTLDRPVLAAVNGPAAGAGCSLALCCDLVVACESARFAEVFINIGLIPDAGSTYFLPRLIGHARALGLAMLGETIDARTAADWGLIWKAVPDNEFADEVGRLAARLAGLPTAAIALIKEAINGGEHHSLEQQLALEAEMQGNAGETEDFQEGRQAFLEKRPARFIGR